jgi:hypothetical protein
VNLHRYPTAGREAPEVHRACVDLDALDPVGAIVQPQRPAGRHGIVGLRDGVYDEVVIGGRRLAARHVFDARQRGVGRFDAADL